MGLKNSVKRYQGYENTRFQGQARYAPDRYYATPRTESEQTGFEIMTGR